MRSINPLHTTLQLAPRYSCDLSEGISHIFLRKKYAWNDVASPAAKLLTVKKIMFKIDLTFWPIIAFEYDTPQHTFWVIISARPKKHYQSNNAADFPKAILYVYSQSYAELKK